MERSQRLGNRADLEKDIAHDQEVNALLGRPSAGEEYPWITRYRRLKFRNNEAPFNEDIAVVIDSDLYASELRIYIVNLCYQAKLTVEEREAVLLHQTHELAFIAGELGCSIKTVRRRLQSGLQKLKNFVSQK